MSHGSHDINKGFDAHDKAKVEGERLRHLLHLAGDAEIADLIEKAASIGREPLGRGAPRADAPSHLDSVEHAVLSTLAAILRQRDGQLTLATLRLASKATLTTKKPSKLLHESHAIEFKPGYHFCSRCHALPNTKKGAEACGYKPLDAEMQKRLDAPIAGCICTKSPNCPPPDPECPVHGELRPLTPEEAEKAYEAAVPMPLSESRLAEIVEYATGTCGRKCAKPGCDEKCILPTGHEGYCSCPGPNAEHLRPAKLAAGAEAFMQKVAEDERTPDAIKKLAAKSAEKILDDHLAALRKIRAPNRSEDADIVFEHCAGLHVEAKEGCPHIACLRKRAGDSKMLCNYKDGHGVYCPRPKNPKHEYGWCHEHGGTCEEESG